MTRQLLIALAFLQLAGADDVTVDVSKLTDFTTTFTFKAKNIQALSPSDRELKGSDLVVRGKLIANVPGEKIKVHLDLSGHIPDPNVQPSQVKDTIVLTFDGPKGYVAAENVGSATAPMVGDLSVSGCVKDKFPPGLVPPPEQVKAMIDQQAPMASAMANQMPHAVRGDLAYYPTDPRTIVALHVADGTPAAVWDVQGATDAESAADLVQGVAPVLKFGDFTESEHFSEVQCSDSAKQMLDQPHSKLALVVTEQVLKHLQLIAPIAPSMAHIAAQFPQMLRNTERSCVVPSEAAIIQAASPVQPLGFSGSVAMCMVSAVAGAGVAFIAARRAFSKTEPVYLEIS